MNFLLDSLPDLCVLKFFSQTCQPCKQIAKLLPKWVEDTGVKVFKVDIEEFPEFTAQFGIRKVPTFVFMRDGVEYDRIVGVPRLSELTEKIQ